MVGVRNKIGFSALMMGVFRPDENFLAVLDFHEKQRRHERDDREDFAKFSRSFAKFLQVFRSFGDVFGPVRTCSDAFGCHRMHSEAFRRSRLCHIPAKPPAPKISEMCALKPFSCLLLL